MLVTLPGKTVPILASSLLDVTLGLLARVNQKNQRWNKPCLFTSVPSMGQTIIFGLAPFPLIDWGQASPSSSEGRGLSSSKKGPSSHPSTPSSAPS